MENLTSQEKETLAMLKRMEGKIDAINCSLNPKAFAEPKEQVFKVTVSGGMGDGQMMRMLSENFNFAKFKVIEITDKELPELYTAEDMIEFAEYWVEDLQSCDLKTSFEDWKNSR